MNVLFLFHTYTFYLLDHNTYQFDFKLHYLACIIFMSIFLNYLFIFLIITVYLYVLTSALGLQYGSIILNIYLFDRK